MNTLEAFLLWLRSGSAARRYAETAFRAKYPGSTLHHVECLAQDDNSYVVQILHGADSCQMASFWAVSKRGSGTREVRSSELTTILVHFSHLTGNHVTSGVASPESVAEI